MGCRSSAPLDVVDGRHREEIFLATGTATNDRASTIEVLTLADLAAFEDRRRQLRERHRVPRRGATRNRNLNQEERLAEIAALQQSLSMMETFFENLVGQTTGFYMEAMDPNNNIQGPPPASDAAIASLVQAPLTAKELSLLHNKMCSVCCEALEEHEVVTRLPCGHFYHPHCVEPWLNRHCTCPACRYELPTDDEDFEEGRMERMKTRKLAPAQGGTTATATTRSAHQGGQDDSSHSSQGRPDVTWDESSETSWGGGEEGVHLLNGFQHWYDDFRERDDEDEARMWLESDTRPSEEETWMIRLIDEEADEDRPTSTLPAAVERLTSSAGDVLEEEVAGDDDTPTSDPTPRASNVSHSKRRRLAARAEDCILVDENECTSTVANNDETSSSEATA